MVNKDTKAILFLIPILQRIKTHPVSKTLIQFNKTSQTSQKHKFKARLWRKKERRYSTLILFQM